MMNRRTLLSLIPAGFGAAAAAPSLVSSNGQPAQATPVSGVAGVTVQLTPDAARLFEIQNCLRALAAYGADLVVEQTTKTGTIIRLRDDTNNEFAVPIDGFGLFKPVAIAYTDVPTLGRLVSKMQIDTIEQDGLCPCCLRSKPEDRHEFYWPEGNNPLHYVRFDHPNYQCSLYYMDELQLMEATGLLYDPSVSVGSGDKTRYPVPHPGRAYERAL